MVFGIFLMTAMVPTIIGVNEASKGTRDHEERRRESARQERCYLSVQCMPSNGLLPQSLAIHNARVYLGADKKAHVHHQIYRFTACPTKWFLLPTSGFPPDNTSGFVTITGETPPTLRWVYVDLQTHELRWGGKQDSEGNICGPFDWTQDEERITLEGWEGWLAVRVPDDEKISEVVGVENSQDLWRLYFDNNDDGADLPQDAEVLEVTIKRTAAES